MAVREVMREDHLREMAPQIAGQLGVTVHEDTARQQKSNKPEGGSVSAENEFDLSSEVLQELRQLALVSAATWNVKLTKLVHAEAVQGLT